jgi:small GTP-binding protein
MYNGNNNSIHSSSNSSEKTVKRIKSVLLGNSGAGKTCVVQRMIYNTFNINSSPTIGAAFSLYTVEPNIKIELWDTAGQERFHSLLPMYARGAEIVIVVIDIEKNMDEQILKWNKYIQDNEKMFSPHYKVILIFNKSDLNTGFEIPTIIMDRTELTFITMVSAKTGYNIDKLKFHLELAAKKIVDEHARTSHEFANMRRNGRATNNGTNSNTRNNDSDTIFGSTFSDMNMNVDLAEYREKMKAYYENSRC